MLRSELLELCSGYKGEILDTSDDIAINSTDHNPSQSVSFAQNVDDKHEEAAEDLRQLEINNEKFEATAELGPTSEIEITANGAKIANKKSAMEPNVVKLNVDNSKKKKKQRDESSLLTTTYQVKFMNDVHDDLISCLDVDTNAQLAVTGRLIFLCSSGPQGD